MRRSRSTAAGAAVASVHSIGSRSEFVLTFGTQPGCGDGRDVLREIRRDRMALLLCGIFVLICWWRVTAILFEIKPNSEFADLAVVTAIKRNVAARNFRDDAFVANESSKPGFSPLHLVDPQRSPQNRPMAVTPKPANENAIRTSHICTLARAISARVNFESMVTGSGAEPRQRVEFLPGPERG